MIVENTPQSSLSYSQLLEKSRATTMDNKGATTDHPPPAYSDLGSDSDLEVGPGIHPRGRHDRMSRRDRRSQSHGRRLNHSHPPTHPHLLKTEGVNSYASSSSTQSPSVDQVHIFDRKHNIDGTFYIDPTVPTLDPSRRQKSKSDEPFPHASFRTRHNTIDLKLGTTGDVRKIGKANVNVSSRDGLVKVTVLPTSPLSPRLGLNVSSRQGSVVVFIPDDYVGLIQLASRKGILKVLPALAARMKIIKASDREIIFIIGNANDNALDTSREASYCYLATRTGDIVVGVANRDHYVPPVGFWQKIGGILKGSS